LDYDYDADYFVDVVDDVDGDELLTVNMNGLI
jgi:hypothetical protein